MISTLDVTAPTGCQRWREHRSSYRPAGEPIDTTRYGVELVDERQAKAFVVGHHYSRSFVAARVRVGLFRARGFWAPELVGTAVFSVPMSQLVIPKWLSVQPAEGVELGRLVLLDDVPANGESWFVARALRIARRSLAVRGVVSFSDPVRVTLADGRVVVPGHVGTVYQSLSARYLGRSNPATRILGADGRVISRRAISKLQSGDVGRDYAERELVRQGAPHRNPHEDSAAWVERALQGFQRVRHPGNHTYVWRFDGANPASLEYPKRAA